MIDCAVASPASIDGVPDCEPASACAAGLVCAGRAAPLGSTLVAEVLFTAVTPWAPLADASIGAGKVASVAAAVVVVVVVVVLVLYRRRRRAGQVNIEARDRSLGQALSTADARLRQISDYVARHRESIGADAQTRLEDAKRHLAAARGKEASNELEAIAYANEASTLAAQAQTLANADVLAAHRTPRRRGTASTR